MRAFLPALLALLNVTVLLAMTTSWAAAWVERTPTLAIRQPAQAGTVHGYITVHGVVSVLVSNLVMLGPVLLALRRWRLPFGTVTLLFTGFALAQVAVHGFDGVQVITAAVVGGLAADTLIGLGALPRRRRSLLVATVVPVVLWSGWLLALAVDRELAWTPALCGGTVMLAALSGLALHVLVFPPSAPAPAGDPLTTRPHRGPDQSGTP